MIYHITVIIILQAYSNFEGPETPLESSGKYFQQLIQQELRIEWLKATSKRGNVLQEAMVNPTNTPLVFRVETTWKRPFQCGIHVMCLQGICLGSCLCDSSLSMGVSAQRCTIMNFINVRGSPPEVFCNNGVLRNFAKFTGKRLCKSLFFNKDAGLRPLIINKKEKKIQVCNGFVEFQ